MEELHRFLLELNAIVKPVGGIVSVYASAHTGLVIEAQWTQKGRIHVVRRNISRCELVNSDVTPLFLRRIAEDIQVAVSTTIDTRGE